MKQDKLNLDFQLHAYARRGGKTSRHRQVERVRQFLAFCRDKGTKEPGQIGKRQVWEWYQDAGLAPSTLRDRFYAVRLLWEFLGRGEPPKPMGSKPVKQGMQDSQLAQPIMATDKTEKGE